MGLGISKLHAIYSNSIYLQDRVKWYDENVLRVAQQLPVVVYIVQ